MAYFKVVPNPVDSDELLFTLCDYITDPHKTENFRYVAARGMTAENTYDEIISMQKYFGKSEGRRAYHLVVSFGQNEGFYADEVFTIGLMISNIFFPEYQLLFAVHTDKDHPHIHYVVNTVSLNTGKKLHFDMGLLLRVERAIDSTVKRFLEMKDSSG